MGCSTYKSFKLCLLPNPHFFIIFIYCWERSPVKYVAKVQIHSHANTKMYWAWQQRRWAWIIWAGRVVVFHRKTFYTCLFQDRVSLWTHFVDQVGLKLTQRSSCFCLPSTGIKVCFATSGRKTFFFKTHQHFLFG